MPVFVAVAPETAFFAIDNFFRMEPLDIQKLKIKERSFFARIARLVLRSRQVAMVLGKTIHLSGVSREIFLSDRVWVAHELCHVQQFQQYGFLRFLWLYLLESWRKGYYMNKFEVEARIAGGKARAGAGSMAGKPAEGTQNLPR